MVVRNRTRNATIGVRGVCRNTSGTVLCDLTATIGRQEACGDVSPGWGVDNPFTSTKRENQRWIIDGTHVHPVTGGRRLFQGCPTTAGWLEPPLFDTWFVPSLDIIDLNNYAWQALADTNPNGSEVNLPSFIAEMRDLPSLVKGWGGSLLRKVAQGHLSWRWAIKPMVNDFRKMLDFTSALDKRMAMFDHLSKGNSMKFRTSLGSDSYSTAWVNSVIHSASGATINGQRRDTHSYNMWATTRWKSSPSYAWPKRRDDVRKLAYTTLYGLNGAGALAAAWELLPWSWLIDWFGGFGDIIAASNNTIPMSHSGVCVMRHLVSRRDYRISTPDFLPLIRGQQFESRTEKARRVANPFLPFQVMLPLCSKAKWSILGSLAVLRTSRPR